MAGRVSSPRFIGRELELTQLGAALGGAAAGEAALVVVTGEAGVGKTRLVSEFGARARRYGAHVLVGGCIPLDQGALPWGPVVEALRELTRRLDPATLQGLVGPARAELGQLLPELAPTAGPLKAPASPHAQGRVFELLLGVLARLGQDAPVVLVLEDVHWADRSTRDLVGFLSHAIGDERLLVLVTYRDDELRRGHPLRPLLGELARSPRVRRVELARFGRAELVAQLTAILGAAPDGALAEEVFIRSDGNAFYAEELLASIRDGGRLPGSLRDTLLVRLDRLPEPTVAVLRAAAAAGRRTHHRLLAAAARLKEGELAIALREAVEQHVLLADAAAGTVTFRHALVQEAIEGELLPGERVRLHSRLAAALIAHPEWAVGVGAAVSAEIAWHWYAAGDWKRALPAAVQAGVQAERVYAFPEAARQFQRVLELWARVLGAERLAGMDQLMVLERAAGAAYYADQLPMAAELVRRALGQVDPVADPVRAGLLHERLGNLLYLVGDAGALAECEAAVRLIPAWPPSAERARVLAAQGWLLCRLFRLGAAADLARAALGVAREAGASREEADALGLLGTALGFQGNATAGLPYLAAVRRRVKDAGDVDRFRYSWLFAMDLLCDLGRFEEARALVREGIELFQRYGYSRMYSGLLESGLAEIDFWVGRWDQAARRNRALLDQATPGSFKRGLFTLIQVRIDAARGDLAAVRQHLESLPAALPGPEGVRQECFRAEARAYLALLERRPAEAITAARDGLAAMHGAEDDERLELLALGLRAAGDLAGQGRRGGSAAEVELLQDADEAFGTELRDVLAAIGTLAPADALVSRAMARQCEAEHARLHGRADPACWARVAAGWDELGQPYPAAQARFRQAEALLAVTGSRAQAREVLNQAAAAARQLGAAPLLRETELLARRSRLRLDDPAAAPARPASTHERFGLTPRERQVLALLVEGCGNREIANRLFVTEKTASFHVSNILAKLGVTSRAQAATAAHRLGLADTADVEPDGQQVDGGSARSPSPER